MHKFQFFHEVIEILGGIMDSAEGRACSCEELPVGEHELEETGRRFGFFAADAGIGNARRERRPQ
jgi:hypothetical protein